MKKVFLSLATIAFVAAGSLTVTSCGSDDSTPNPEPGPGPEPTSNYVEWDGSKSSVDGSMFEIQGTGTGQNFQPSLYTLTNQEGHYLRYYTTYWQGDIENATEIADLAVYGMISYYAQVKDVELNDQGQVVDYTFVNPNEAEVIRPAGASLYFDGTSVGQATAAGITVNTFVMSAGEGTASFEGQSTHGTAGTAKVTYNGASSFSTYVPSGAKSTSNLDIKKSLKDNNFAKEVKSLKTISL